jgi:NMD protein affecting ribosome stability and mRNA decay
MIKDIYRIEIEMEQGLSPESKKISTEYYELKVQFRCKYFEMTDSLEKVTNISLNDIKQEIYDSMYKNFDTINKFEELDDGFDFYIRSLRDLHKISRVFNKRYYIDEKRSKKIVGMNLDNRKDIARHTLLLTILNFNVGDLVSIKGEEYYIKAFNKKDLVLRKADTGAKKVVTYSVIKDYFKLLKKFNS